MKNKRNVSLMTAGILGIIDTIMLALLALGQFWVGAFGWGIAFAIWAMVSIFATVVCFVYANKPFDKVNKTLLALIIVLSGIITGLLVNVYISQNNKNAAMANNIPNSQTTSSQKIININSLYENGTITKEERDMLVQDIFTNSSQNN